MTRCTIPPLSTSAPPPPPDLPHLRSPPSDTSHPDRLCRSPTPEACCTSPLKACVASLHNVTAAHHTRTRLSVRQLRALEVSVRHFHRRPAPRGWAGCTPYARPHFLFSVIGDRLEWSSPPPPLPTITPYNPKSAARSRRSRMYHKRTQGRQLTLSGGVPTARHNHWVTLSPNTGTSLH
ncbi:hypothetical protein E2C01_042336 [Portunus trituberculatus]|uniref:Uncharacterized protein n=1 Tax=Portunus trituberculatus TaxID=210409 RepID=A0A5B7FTE4_PORTR|nr:hypothetical protein [Portunus trituberculatus]